MPIELKPHNEETYRKVKEKLNTSNKVAVIHPTGTGKMYIALKMVEENKGKKAIYVAPSNAILHDVKKNIFAEGMNMTDFPNLKRITYRKLASLSDEEIEDMDFDIIVLDEFHHCGAPEWGKGVERLLQKNQNANVLGLSATPLRYLDGLRDMSDELFDNNVASEMTLEEAIEQGILPEATYVSALYDYNAELENMQENINKIKDREKREQAQALLDILRKKLDENTKNLPELFAKYMQKKNGKYIIFCRNIQDMQEKMEQASTMFGKVNSNITIRGVSSKIKENDRILSDFESDNDDETLKLLYSVNMLNEGYHIKNLDGVVMMRPTLSPTVFTQQLGRALTVGSDKIPIVLDLVNNFSTCRIIEDFTERMRQYKGRKGPKVPKEEEKSKISIFDKTKEFMEIANKITELSKRNIVTLDEKIEIFEKFNETGEELTGDTVFEGYPVGYWAVQIRSQIKQKNEGTKKVTINPTEKQLEKLDALGILERRIEATIDEKIGMLVEWMAKYPKAKISTNIPEDVLRNYATTEEEYKRILEEYKKMQRYYDYVTYRQYGRKLTKEQISKCKEGNIRGPFGYPTEVEELANKSGEPQETISYILINYGTMKHFIDLYRNGELDENDTILADNMIRNVIDIDLNPDNEKYDALYEAITLSDSDLKLYSSERLKAQLETLTEKEKYVIERMFGILSDDFPNLETVGAEIKVTEQRVGQIKTRALRKLRSPMKLRKFSYDLNKRRDMLTDDECRIIDSLRDNLDASDFVFRNNPQGLNSIIENEDILKAIELIKNMDQIVAKSTTNFDIDVEELDLSVRTFNILKRANINTLGAILQLTEKDIIRLRDSGQNTIKEVKQILAEYGLTLREETQTENSGQSSETVEARHNGTLKGKEDSIAQDISADDTFITDIVENATKRHELREQDEQAKKLAQSYEKLYGKADSKDAHPFDDNK